MSWFGGQTEFDGKVEAATTGAPEQDTDLPKVLEICDQVRSKAVLPKEAMRSLKRRIGNKNPNIQLAALKLTDACIKNGGNHFLTEVASREFIDNIVSLLKSPAGINRDVKEKMLELLQLWALAFEGKSNLSYVSETIRSLKTDGFTFPPSPDHVSTSLVDSSAPPDWADSEVCMRCRTPFSFTNRKHHCRNCGNAFDQYCSSRVAPLPHLGIMHPVRVCESCYTSRMEASTTQPQNSMPSLTSRRNSSTSSAKNSSSRPHGNEGDDDDDLKRALRMSLEESKMPQGYTSAPKSATSVSKPPIKEENEDEDLKAAIAASLREATAATGLLPQKTFDSTLPIEPYKPSPYEISSADSDNINLFATLIDRLQTAPPGAILKESQLQELYDSIGVVRPKLARSLGDAVSKYEMLVDMHAKLQTIVRYYDNMLEARLSQAYGRHSVSSRPQQDSYRPATRQYSGTSQPDNHDLSYYKQNSPTDGRVPQYNNGAIASPPSQQPQMNRATSFGSQPQMNRASSFGSHPDVPSMNAPSFQTPYSTKPPDYSDFSYYQQTPSEARRSFSKAPTSPPQSHVQSTKPVGNPDDYSYYNTQAPPRMQNQGSIAEDEDTSYYNIRPDPPMPNLSSKPAGDPHGPAPNRTPAPRAEEASLIDL